MLLINNIYKHLPRTLKILYRKIKKLFFHTKRKTVLKEFDGILFSLEPNYISDKNIIEKNSYDPTFRLLAKHIVKEGSVVFDVGANIGLHSVYLSNLVGEKGKVYAFEPVNFLIKKIIIHKYINKANNLIIINKAVGDKNKGIRMYQVKENDPQHGYSSVVMNDSLSNFSKDRIQNTDVEMITLDSFSSQNNLTVDFIKMDIEGYEYFALVGAKELLKRDKPVMIIEYSIKRIEFVGVTNDMFKELIGEIYNCYEMCEQNPYEDYVSLEAFHFDRDLKYRNILCIPRLDKS